MKVYRAQNKEILIGKYQFIWYCICGELYKELKIFDKIKTTTTTTKPNNMENNFLPLQIYFIVHS